MPTKAQVEFFAKWNAAAHDADRAADRAVSMAQRLDAAARLSMTTPKPVNKDAQRR